MNNDNERLSRIENKLDKLTDVVVQLATHNERIITLEEKVRNQGKRIEGMDKVINHNSKITWLIAIVIPAVVSYFVKMIISGG
ncbi:hypothetical protein [Endozoicomonas acroporae]|uniref:hypothetical protein n=1 Tax=Endozoicomonas acroporae TaxID=1701104 RepID=UPI003D7BBC5B